MHQSVTVLNFGGEPGSTRTNPRSREGPRCPTTESDASSAAISTIARNVRALRNEHGWTLDELAGRSSVSKGMLVQIEQNRTNPSIGILSRIAEAFGVSLAALVELDQSPTVRLVEPRRGGRALARRRRAASADC